MAGFQSDGSVTRDIEAQQFGIVAGLPTLNTTGIIPTAKVVITHGLLPASSDV